ncbi:bacterial regulatory helix-turn-helix, lysR family protein [Methyloversatilis sp. RAC08]|uniref:LysR family transcriptional regulator n=1 Tax=Methyloversatilis sp. RAC08 TaxID=1842540 RepID=UPI00083DEA9F|nr:LysR family transcriptional regulator [Methyloversatilis sp. RAC08]AOF80432.1 bacterial regulatory helix-turn-helix, lysR family protein [Methyloversatilis sp. RAC08]
MELYQIRYCLAVAETLNFTRAAERCFVSQPALTKAIQKLEDALGGLLFDRSKVAVSLTDFGRSMLPSLQQIYAATSQTRELARRLQRDRAESVRVGIICTIDLNAIFPAFLAFQHAFPKADIQFREGSMEALIDALDKGDIDVALLASPFAIARRFSGPVLYTEDFVVAHGPAHRFGQRAALSLTDLQGEAYCQRSLCEFSLYIERVMAERGVDVKVVQQTPREDWVQTMVRAGVGVAFMAESTALSGGLSFSRVPDARFAREVRAMVLGDRPHSGAVDQLLGFLPGFDWSHIPCLKKPDATG